MRVEPAFFIFGTCLALYIGELAVTGKGVAMDDIAPVLTLL